MNKLVEKVLTEKEARSQTALNSYAPNLSEDMIPWADVISG